MAAAIMAGYGTSGRRGERGASATRYTRRENPFTSAESLAFMIPREARRTRYVFIINQRCRRCDVYVYNEEEHIVTAYTQTASEPSRQAVFNAAYRL